MSGVSSNPAVWAGFDAPRGMVLAWKVVRPDGRTRGEFRWPFEGEVRCDPERIVHGHAGPCPSGDGDGLCLALSWRGAASGGIPAITGLAVAYRDEDVLGRDETKLRVSACQVLGVLDVPRLLRKGCGKEANLARANLTGANLTGANLTGANLTRANLTGANLTGANLTGANLTGANLTWANLTGANLARANLTWANLTWANLARANLTGANLTGANLTGADLTGANLTGANLTGANLTGADLTGANLTGANLTGANLTWADNVPAGAKR